MIYYAGIIQNITFKDIITDSTAIAVTFRAKEMIASGFTF